VNFGTILNSVTKTCVKLMLESKDSESKQLAKGFVTYVNLKEPLKNQFHIYTQLNGAYIEKTSSAELFINETLSTITNFTFADIKAYNALLETKFNVEKIKPSDIDKDIGTLIKFKSKGISTRLYNQLDYIQAMERMVEHITTKRNKKESLNELSDLISNSSLKFLTPKHVIAIGVKSFNNKYKGLFNEGDRQLFLLLKTKNENEIEEYYQNLIEQLNRHYKSLSPQMDDALKTNLNECIKMVSKERTVDTIINGYEMLCELEKLNEFSMTDFLVKMGKEFTPGMSVANIYKLFRHYGVDKSKFKDEEDFIQQMLKKHKHTKKEYWQKIWSNLK